ncbi:MAG: hypothetical protein EHM47_06250 [Ignavibacteriales bacterium]|nr:MAG: hypothetical protein EHM47_06250 [Ignavibacteriales bacterium]
MKILKALLFTLILILFMSESTVTYAQVSWVVGGRMGLSIASSGFGSSAGFQFGPMGEVLFNRNMAFGTEFNINTQSGTPIEWANQFKYYFDVPQSDIKPYVDGGFNLLFITGGPYFGIRFGGGANFPIAPNLYIPADIQLGPIFTTGSTSFYIAITSGIRYYIPSY